MTFYLWHSFKLKDFEIKWNFLFFLRVCFFYLTLTHCIYKTKVRHLNALFQTLYPKKDEFLCRIRFVLTQILHSTRIENKTHIIVFQFFLKFLFLNVVSNWANWKCCFISPSLKLINIPNFKITDAIAGPLLYSGFVICSKNMMKNCTMSATYFSFDIFLLVAVRC